MIVLGLIFLLVVGYPKTYDAVCDSFINTQNCSMDRLLISKRGDSQLADSKPHRGYGTLKAGSVVKNISLGIVKTAVFACGNINMKSVVGGEETHPNEFPMMAGIVYVGENAIKCGAVIIDNRYVLTAAHCVISKNISKLAVVVGEHDVRTGLESPALQVFRVASVIIHPEFKADNNDNDIAIIQIHGSIVYSKNVGPVCLPFKFIDKDFTGAKVTILGWGTIFPGGPTSKVLQKVDVNVVSQATCSTSYPTVSNKQMCTFAEGKDACQNDSGGPLLYQDPSNGRLYSVGIVSFGLLCASAHPNVNTRVTSYLYWILKNAPANYSNA